MRRKSTSSESPADGRRSRRMEKAVAIVLVLLALVIGLLFTIGEGMIQRKDKSPAPVPVAEKVTPVPQPMEPAALAALEAFFEAPDLAAKAPLVRDSARVRPMMEDYHERRGHPFPTLGRVTKTKAGDLNGTPLVFFEVEPFSGPCYPLAAIWDGKRFAVDWESLTAYGTIDWSEFLEKRPTTSHTLRVYLQAAKETESIPGAPAGSVTFRIEHRDDPQPLLALAASPLAGRLSQMVAKQRVPMTLEVVWKASVAGAPQVPEIIQLLAPGWSL